MTYQAPSYYLDRALANLRPAHPFTPDDLIERANLVAANMEAQNLKVVPPDHPWQPDAEGKLPNVVLTPPPPCLCCHCGTPVPEGQHEADYQVEGCTLTVRVAHCDDCHRQPACMMACTPRNGG